MIYSAIILLISIISTIFPNHASAQLPTTPTFFANACFSTSGNYTTNSLYENNLKSVLSDLVAHASAGLSFNSSSAGIGTDSAVYGVYYCRGDISPNLCSDCVKAAAKTSVGPACFNIMDGSIWYYECTLEYTSKPKLGVLEIGPYGWLNSTLNVSDQAGFISVLANNMKTIIQKAAYGDNSGGFAIGKADAPMLQKLYTLVQCRPDINGSDCDTCLRSAYGYINTCCRYSAQWVLVFYPGCQLRYQLQPFYYTSATPPPPPPAFSPSIKTPPSNGKGHITIIVVSVSAVLILLLVLVCGGWLCCRKRKYEVATASQNKDTDTLLEDVNECEIGNVQCFDFKTIEIATLHFSNINKLGQGGFGSVYKAVLPNGQFAAVKRLSKTSSEPHIKEFKTEVGVMAKLQHRNLVRLHGFSVTQEERILVYEFLPNLSLDKFLFDANKSMLLDWARRYKIIEGIAWGIRYLHVDSLLTIVHRDLKSSNILLDKEMNPKIADFGLAKLVSVDQATINVSTIAGTMGYMSPEYAMGGRCTVKSDIYSFGVIILEIISGKNIGNFYDPISGDGLLHHAFNLWKNKAIEGLLDPILQNKEYSLGEIERCAQIGLLCVQDDEDMRPTIRVLLSMMENKSSEISNPSPATVYTRNKPMGDTTTSVGNQPQSSQAAYDELSTSNVFHNEMYPR